MKTIKFFYKKSPKTVTFIITFLLLFSLTSGGYLLYHLSLYKNINLLTIVTISLGITILISNLLLFIIGIKLTLKRKYFTLFFYLIIWAASASGLIYFTYNYVSTIYSSLTNLSEKSSVYNSKLVINVDSDIKKISDLKNNIIGSINSDINLDQSNNANEIIDKLNLDANNEIKIYDDYIYMIKDLLSNKIEAAILPGSYEKIYKETEGLENLNTKLISIYSKDFTIKSNVKQTKKITEPFTLLIMGIDGTGENIDQANSLNGDSLMLITFNPKTLNTTILSIPRDSYVPITCLANRKRNKITHAGIGGEKCMISTIENFTDITIDYYVKINFSGVVKLVDHLGGIKVDVPIEFCEQDSLRRKGNHEICLKPGTQILKGEEALALSRHRKTIDDFRRGYNQQLVVNATLNKAKNSRNLNTITNMIKTLSNSMKTNMTTSQILSLFDLFQKSTGKEEYKLDRLYLSGYGKMIYEPSYGFNLYNYVLYDGSVKDSVEAMKINLEIKKPELIKQFSFDINEPYELPEIGRGNYTQNKNIGNIIPNFIGNNKAQVQAWCNSHNVKVNFIEKVVTEQSKNNLVINQSHRAGVDAGSINIITITIGKYEAPVPVTVTPNEVPDETAETTDTEETIIS